MLIGIIKIIATLFMGAIALALFALANDKNKGGK